jgi:pyrroloquinoline quinone (PQQ) biosynthesis protein C
MGMTTTGWNTESVDAPSDALDDLSDRPVADAMARALEGRELLTHPFYLRWQAGELAPGELTAYAVQYRAFEAALPAVLGAVVDKLEVLGEVEAAATVGQNLGDEVGRPEPHLALFDRFRDALEARGDADGTVGTEPGPAAQALVATYVQLVAEGPVAALAGLAAYETQAAAIATSKGEGLRRWYGLDEAGTEFWDVHARMEADHGEWALDALTLLGADPAEVADAARRGADAWWALLDERQAEAPAPV